MKLILLVLASASLALGQVSFGVKAGVPFNDTLDVATNVANGRTNNTRRFTVGPSFELRLPWGLGVEVDALYKNFDYGGTGSSTTSLTGSTWQVPVLVKKRFGSGAMRPYLGAGPSFRRLFGSNDVTSWFLNEISNRNGVGGVVEGGVEFHAGPLKISPEIRFTRWSAPSFASAAQGVLNLNQAEFLVGVAF